MSAQTISGKSTTGPAAPQGRHPLPPARRSRRGLRARREETGARVTAVSDVFGGVENEGGLDIAALGKHVAAGRPVPEFAGGRRISNDELWQVP
jgi:hypothetical protein